MEQITTYDELKAKLETLTPDEFGSEFTFTLTSELAQAILDHDPVNRTLRPAKVVQYTRAISEGTWYPPRALPLMFHQDGRLADGQHRCHAVIAANASIPTRAIVVKSTYGVDEGIPRTLADYLNLIAKLDKKSASFAATVTKNLCEHKAPTDAELMACYDQHTAFILECVQKPLAWLAEHEREVARVIKPAMLIIVRAKAIHHEKLSAAAVDELLYDVVQQGVNGGPGSYADQIWQALYKAYRQQSKIGTAQLLGFLRSSIETPSPVGAKIKNIITATKRKGKKSAVREAA